MPIRNLIAGWKTSSTAGKIGVGAVALGVLLLIAGAVHLYHSHVEAKLTKQQETLKQQNQQLTDSYNQALGQAKAFEVSAREEKQKSDALRSEYERRIGNAAALDKKIETAEKNYEQAKAEMGDCGETQAECLRRLCLEQQKAGFKVKCD